MARSRFINPLFQRTEPETAEPEAQPVEAITRPDDLEEAAPPENSAATSTSARPAASPRARTRRPEPQATEAPVKFTFYFSPDQLRRLDDLWLRAKLDFHARLNKSEFVRLALDHLLEDFEKNPQRVLQQLKRQRR